MVDPSQKISNFPADPGKLKELLSSPEGRRLLRLLQSDGGAAVQQAARAMQSGDAARARAALRTVLKEEEAAALGAALAGKL